MANMDILPAYLFLTHASVRLCQLSGMSANPQSTLFNAFNEAVMRIVNWIMLLAPVLVFSGLIAGRIGRSWRVCKEFLPELAAVGKYSMTVDISTRFPRNRCTPNVAILFWTTEPNRICSQEWEQHC